MDSLPLISCIMPTRNRSAFVAQSVTYFLAQDYKNKELLIVDDSESDDWSYSYPSADIRSVYITETLTTGMKRTIACSLAHGEIICHWDDDDYYGPRRLSVQVAPLLRGEQIVTALKMSLLFDARKGTVWAPSEDIHRTLFPRNVRASTLMYQASYWQAGVQYASTSMGEDSQMLDSLLARGATLVRVTDPASYICVRHGCNTTRDIDGVGLPEWTQVPLEDAIPAEYLPFYAGLRTKEAA